MQACLLMPSENPAKRVDVAVCMHDAPIMGQLHKPLQKTMWKWGVRQQSDIKIKGVFSVNTYCCCRSRLREGSGESEHKEYIEDYIREQECRGR